MEKYKSSRTPINRTLLLILLTAYYLAEHRNAPRPIHSRADINAVVDDLLQQDFDHRVASITQTNATPREQRSELMIGVLPKRQVGLLSYWGSEGRYFSVGTSESQEELMLYMCGSEFHFPGNAVISLSEVRAGAAEFLESGGVFPRGTQWRLAE